MKVLAFTSNFAVRREDYVGTVFHMERTKTGGCAEAGDRLHCDAKGDKTMACVFVVEVQDTKTGEAARAYSAEPDQKFTIVAADAHEAIHKVGIMLNLDVYNFAVKNVTFVAELSE